MDVSLIIPALKRKYSGQNVKSVPLKKIKGKWLETEIVVVISINDNTAQEATDAGAKCS
jgi:hypothetical protein